MLNILIREAEPPDLNFIYATFSKSVKMHSVIGRYCPSRLFFRDFTKVIDKILMNDDVRIDVASDHDEPTVIYGYMISQPKIVHYVYVKAPFQKLGIATQLFQNRFGPDESVEYSFCTQATKGIYKSKPNLLFNPFNLYLGA